jgi:hypothetical protein
MQPELTGRDLALTVDVLVTWIGAAALGRCAFVLGRSQARSTLERRARFLMGTLAAMCLLRGFSWLRPESVGIGYLVSVPNSLLPLAMTLFVEGLLRRHVPRWMKWVATAATVIAFMVTVLPLIHSGERTGALVRFTLLGALMVTMVSLAVVLARTDRSSLSRSEHALIRICVLVAALAVPLAVTDFRAVISWLTVRMGTLGALLLCYSILGRPQNATLAGWLRDVSRLVFRGLLVSVLLVVALQTVRAADLMPVSVLAIAVVFALAVWDRLRNLDAMSGDSELLEWLAREPPASRDAFAVDLRSLRLTVDAVVVGDGALAMYDHDAIARAFPPGVVVQSLGRLRALQEGEALTARGADDLSDLLEKRGATHVGLLSSAPLFLLVITVPHVGSRDIELAISAVVRRWPHTTPMTHAAAD